MVYNNNNIVKINNSSEKYLNTRLTSVDSILIQVIISSIKPFINKSY